MREQEEIAFDLGFYRIVLAAMLFIRDQGCKHIDHFGGSCINPVQVLVMTWTRLIGEEMGDLVQR